MCFYFFFHLPRRKKTILVVMFKGNLLGTTGGGWYWQKSIVKSYEIWNLSKKKAWRSSEEERKRGREDRNVRSVRSNHPSPTLALPSPNTTKSPATQLVVFAPHIALVSYELICFLTFVFEWVNVTKTLRYVCRNISNTIILPFDSSDTHFSKHLSCFV